MRSMSPVCGSNQRCEGRPPRAKARQDPCSPAMGFRRSSAPVPHSATHAHSAATPPITVRRGRARRPPPRRAAATRCRSRAAALEALRGVLAARRLHLLHEGRTLKGRLEGRERRLVVADRQRLELLVAQLEGGVAVGAGEAAVVVATPAARRPAAHLALHVRLHREPDAALCAITAHDAHLHLLTDGQHVADRADAALLDGRDVQQAVDALLDRHERTEVRDRVDLAGHKLLVVGALVLGEVGALLARRAVRWLLARQRELVFLEVDRLDLAGHRLASSQLLVRVLDELVTDLRHVQQAVGRGADVDKRAVGHDAADLAFDLGTGLELSQRRLRLALATRLRRLLRGRLGSRLHGRRLGHRLGHRLGRLRIAHAERCPPHRDARDGQARRTARRLVQRLRRQQGQSEDEGAQHC
mmetsp:Transcript_37444/g.93554  ORF Transcript_37444/g.93554 Transcript_37444/m.93554 type:complete len:415 (+) Transcript_37444:264-1508(+)